MADIDGDGLKPGPDGHIRHPTERDLVWWEDAAGNRFWVRQNRWYKSQDIKTERSAPEAFVGVPEWRAKVMKRELREEGVRYKVRNNAPTDWNADEGPWEVPA